MILDEARLQIIGLTLIERLRTAGLSFQEINELTTQGFINAANEHFKLKGDAAAVAPDAGWELEEDDAKRMLATIKLAFRNEDMARLLKHSREALTAETGGSYYDLEEFDTSLRVNVPILDVDVDISDTVNVWNVFVFLGPNALVNTKGSGFLDFAHPTVSSSAQNVMTLKEAVATRAGLPKLARMLGEMEGGGELMRDFITFYEKSSFVGRWTADAMIGWYARTGAEVPARVTAMRAGLSHEDQEWWARVVGEICTALNTYGAGDIDVTYRMARHGAKASVVKSLAEAQSALRGSVTEAEQTAQLLSEYSGRLEQILGRMDAGELGPADIAGLRRQMTELRDEILSIRSRVNAGEAGAELRVRQEALEQACSSMEAASFGQAEVSGRCAQAVREAREAVLDRIGRMREDTASVEGVMGRVRNAPEETGAGAPVPAEPGATGEVISVTSGRQLDYSGRIFRDTDDLMMQGQFRRAAGAYEEWLDLMAHRKMQGTDLWDDVSRKLREAQLADEAQRRWLAGGSQTVGELKFEREFGPEELERLMKDPDIVLVPVGQGASDPLFVCEKIKVGQLRNGQIVGEAWTAQPIAVFKPDSGRFGAMSGQAEDFFSWLSRKAGLRAPATSRGELQFQGRLARAGNDWIELDGPAKNGTFVRFAPGTDWRQIIEMDPSMAHVLKKAYGEDIAFSAWCGDWDRHALNHRITADGHVLHMDRNNAQLREELSTPLTPGTPATPEQIAEMKRIMLTRLRMMWTAASGGQSLYQPTAWMERYLSLDDFAPTLRKIDEITPDMMRQRLNQMPELTDLEKEQIIAQLQLRQRLLPEVLDEFVAWTRTRPDALAPSDWIETAPRFRVKPMPIQPAPEPRDASMPPATGIAGRCIEPANALSRANAMAALRPAA